jgi:hypothetical protein
MSIAFLSRTLIVLIWLTAVLWHGGRDVPTMMLAVSLVAVWVAPLLRDRARRHAVPSVG